MGSNKCPKCGAICGDYRNPFPTVDILLLRGRSIAIIKRKNPPYGWALPGGFIDYGETAEHAAIRETKEETNLDIVNPQLFGVYSDPARDPRAHTMSIVYHAKAEGEARAQDDATEIKFVEIEHLVFGVFEGVVTWDKPTFEYDLAFDHKKIITDFFNTFFT
jgi:ADP-ribose pyrophosphatase YjhB (NUDIX family)